MKTLVAANQKGGVGKTATVVHLAYDFLERGLRVAVADLDVNKNASHTLKSFATGITSGQLFGADDGSLASACAALPAEGPLLWTIPGDESLIHLHKLDQKAAVQSFKANVATIAKHFDVLVIDTPATFGTALKAALFSADFLLSPIEMETYSLIGIGQMIEIFKEMKRLNPKLNFIGMVPSKVDGRNPRHVQHLVDLRAKYKEWIVPTPVGLRTSIGDAMSTGQPVWKNKKTAARVAAAEVRALAAHVFGKMEIQQ